MKLDTPLSVVHKHIVWVSFIKKLFASKSFGKSRLWCSARQDLDARYTGLLLRVTGGDGEGRWLGANCRCCLGWLGWRQQQLLVFR